MMPLESWRGYRNHLREGKVSCVRKTIMGSLGKKSRGMDSAGQKDVGRMDGFLSQTTRQSQKSNRIIHSYLEL